MQKLFTGLQPSGILHIGNYFGALRQTVELLKDREGLVMLADYHALTSLKNPAELRTNIVDLVKDYIAVGIDPSKDIIFKQSDVPEHTELAWIFDCLVTVPFLMQAHAYKDKVTKGLEANAGLFTYPMLMAADILLYDADIVPVGADQRQHVEYAREAAAKFNAAFGETFKEPQERILEAVATVPGTDGKKMSKSYGNTIPLFGTKDEIAKAVMSIVTDSGTAEELNMIQTLGENDESERPINLYRIHRHFQPKDKLSQLYKANQNSYKTLKETLIEDVDALVAPMRELRSSITDDDVRAILKEGGARARERASKKMADVREKVGVTI